jgi:dipeptidyl aminopeptidase/acylaminoacyl peptidase
VRRVLGTVAEPQWAPDGRHLAWVAAGKDAPQLLVAAGDGHSEPIRANGSRGVAGTRGGTFAWVDATRIVFVDADGQLAIVGLDGSSPRDGPPVRGCAAAPAASARGDVSYVDETTDACVVVVAPLDGSRAPHVVTRADFAWDPAWSPAGELLAWHEWDFPAMPWDESRIVISAADGSDATVVAGAPEESVGQPRFAPAGPRRLAFVSDRSGFANVVVADPSSTIQVAVRTEAHEHAEPAWGPGQRSFAWSPDGRLIAWCRNEAGFGRLVVAALDDADSPTDLAKGWHRHLDWSSAGIAATRSGARTAPSITVVEPGTGARRVIATAGEPEPGPEPVEPEVVTWAADDGTEIRGLLSRRRETFADEAPLLVMVHSGPNSQAIVDWDERVQHFVSRGWTVLAPNYRGSTGAGRAFTQSLAGQWGTVDVSDTIDGIRTAVTRGLADPRRIAVIGSSAGGFTALLVAAAAPALVAAVVASYPVTDLCALAAGTHRFESHALDRHVGVLPDAVDVYRARSPINRVAEIRAPVLVMQGDADVVVSVSDTTAFVDALRAHGGDVQYHVYAGAGHGWSPEITANARDRTDHFLTTKVLQR